MLVLESKRRHIKEMLVLESKRRQREIPFKIMDQ